ncbi:MAG TPA: hypothetical protein VK324_15085, partial [Tepidisphaeraceae bacterium]|nr:hypothetical protein [Tepidisphaeraceae bacterium]
MPPKTVHEYNPSAHRAAPKAAASGSADLWAGVKLGVRRWARDTFSRQSLTNSVRSLVWVAPLTVLVWVYAERQEQAREERMTFTVDVRSGDPNHVVTVLDRDGKPARDLLLVADLTGPRQGVERAKAQLLRSVAKPAVQVTVDPPKDAGAVTVPIVGQVESSDVFQSNGVSLSNLSQGVVTVYVDPIREETVDVSPPDAIADVTTTFVSDPRTVKVRGPASVL